MCTNFLFLHNPNPNICISKERMLQVLTLRHSMSYQGVLTSHLFSSTTEQKKSQ